MSDPKLTRRRSRWAGGALAAVAAACAIVLSSAIPASAHDQILSTTPADGQNVASAPTEINLRFTEEVLSVGAIVIVVDSAGTDWADGKVRLDQTEATQPLKTGQPDGAYEVRWRVVSADGHPVSGAFAYSVGAGSSGGSVSQATVTATPAPGAADAVVNPGTVAAEPDGGLPILVVGLIGALAGIGVFTIVAVLARKRSRRRES